jgi:hypothetical protein
MKIWLTAFLVLIYSGLIASLSCFSQDRIEVNLTSKQVKLVGFSLGGYKIDGTFLFSYNQEKNSSYLEIEGKDVTCNNKKIPWLKIKLTKAGEVVFINSFSFPQFKAKGRIDFKQNDLNLDIEASWFEKRKTLEGQIKAKVKVWGAIDDFLASGSVAMEDGRYKDREFLNLSLVFLGKPPLFNITDSEIILTDGSVFGIEGVLDLRDYSNLIPDAEFVAQKIFVGEWQLFSQDFKKVGLKKNVDDKIDVFLSAEGGQEEGSGAGTELRYNLRDDKFLGLRKEGDRSTLRFERRKDF